MSAEPSSGRKVVVITGASRGIGAATARLAGHRGWSVVVNYRTGEAEAQKVVGAVKETGGEAIAVQADTAVASQVVELFEAVDERLGQIDALVNNAGILGPPMPLEATDAEFMCRMLAVNVAGCFLCLREAAKRMKSRGGAIVNIGSRLSELGGAGGTVLYAATKGAIDTLTIGAARELAADGIRVNCVSPGVIDTEIHASTGMADRMQQLTKQIPAGRPGSAEEVAEAVLWLLSDKASYVSGAHINVSGGR